MAKHGGATLCVCYGEVSWHLLSCFLARPWHEATQMPPRPGFPESLFSKHSVIFLRKRDLEKLEFCVPAPAQCDTSQA